MTAIARSFLFVPGHRPERFAKAAASGAHEIILDLEDAVAPEGKAQARAAVAEWLAAGRNAFVRINAEDTEWFGEDIGMLTSLPGAGAMLPKANAQALQRLAAAVPGRRMLALIETVAGVMDLRRICAIPTLERIAFGSVDFAVESGILDEGDAMTGVRVQFVLESRYAGLPAPVDGVGLDELGVCTQLVQVADERVHEAVVVVDDQDAPTGPARHSTITSSGFNCTLTHGKTWKNSA